MIYIEQIQLIAEKRYYGCGVVKPDYTEEKTVSPKESLSEAIWETLNCWEKGMKVQKIFHALTDLFIAENNGKGFMETTNTLIITGYHGLDPNTIVETTITISTDRKGYETFEKEEVKTYSRIIEEVFVPTRPKRPRKSSN
jgi:hypothetical protein